MLAARQAAKTLCCLQGQASTCARSLCLGTVSMDKVTHTGQKFEEKDPRNVRFAVTGLEKQVNTEWAIDLIAKVPPIEVNTRIVACDGGGGALGHPKVYINLDDGKPKGCIYCGLRFVYKH